MQTVLLKSSGTKPLNKIRIKTEKKFGMDEERVIVCVNCGNPVTLPEKIISVDGRHMHVFTNPEDFEYEIGCFSSAEGCMNIGESTYEHSWFEGFNWSISICSGCLVHLGWFYQSPSESFYGLIMDLLTDDASTS